MGVSAGKAHIVELLLQNGANIETVDDEGRSALLIATYKGHLRVVELLLEAAANIHVIDNVSCLIFSLYLYVELIHMPAFLLRRAVAIW